MTKKVTNKAASDLVKLRWAKLTPKQRSNAVPHNGGRRREYEPCPNHEHGYHNFSARKRTICQCGQVKIKRKKPERI